MRKQRLKPRRIPTKAQITYTTPVFPQRLRKARLHPARASRPANKKPLAAMKAASGTKAFTANALYV